MPGVVPHASLAAQVPPVGITAVRSSSSCNLSLFCADASPVGTDFLANGAFCSEQVTEPTPVPCCGTYGRVDNVHLGPAWQLAQPSLSNSALPRATLSAGKLLGLCVERS